VLIYALFPQVGLKFLENRNNPAAFEAKPGSEPEPVKQAVQPVGSAGVAEIYQVEVNGVTYDVKVTTTGAVTQMQEATTQQVIQKTNSAITVTAPLAGNIYKINVIQGQEIAAGDVVMILEAMKMETEVRATAAGKVTEIFVKAGDAVQVNAPLLSLT
jgi:oxaloacetate decarboxylase alpha subunit